MSRPPATDIINKLPHANEGYEAHRPLGAIEIIGVHYDAANRAEQYDPLARYLAQAAYHIQKDWDTGPGYIPGFGLMYHYKISGDGRLWITQPEDLVTWAVNNANRKSLNICVDCGTNQGPTTHQLDTLASTLEWLTNERPEIPAGRADVWGHLELRQYGNSTACPGRLLPYVQQYRAGQWGAGQVPPPAPTPPPIPRPEVHIFTETGFSVAGGFLTLWQGMGERALEIMGYPISFEYAAKGKTFQDFENVGVEWYPGIQPRIRAANREYLEHMRSQHPDLAAAGII